VTGRAQSAGVALSFIAGKGDAERLLAAIQHDAAPADALLEAFDLVAATGDRDRLRGFARRLRKQLEAKAER
jgi:hypothetical protein